MSELRLRSILLKFRFLEIKVLSFKSRVDFNYPKGLYRGVLLY